jgi:hypothetical protein
MPNGMPIFVAIWLLGWFITPIVLPKADPKGEQIELILTGLLLGAIWPICLLGIGLLYVMVYVVEFYIWLAKKI